MSLCFCKGHGDAAVKLQRDWLLEPQTLPFAQHIKTHALVSLLQKGLQYHQIEQSLDQVSSPPCAINSNFLFRSISREIENLHPQPLYCFSVPRPVGQHPSRNKNSLMMNGQALQVHENMAGILILMDYPLISPHRHRHQNGVGGTMSTHPPTAIEQTATACKLIKMATIFQMYHQYHYRRIITVSQKMVQRLMAWT